MNNSKVFKILSYICLVLTILISFLIAQPITVYSLEMVIPINLILLVINCIMAIIFIIKTLKKEINNVNILFPITYLVFVMVVIGIAVIINNKLFIPYIHFNYYFTFVLFNYLLLNIYSLISIKK